MSDPNASDLTADNRKIWQANPPTFVVFVSDPRAVDNSYRRYLMNQLRRECGFGGVIAMGEVSEPVCEVPVELNRVGMILLGGLTPVAAVQEAGIEVENYAMSAMIDYQELVSFAEVFKRFTAPVS